MGRLKGVKQTGEVAKYRKTSAQNRENYKKSIISGEVNSHLPELIFPEIFKDIREAYWECLKKVPDPRNPKRAIYPLHLILHRIISGFIGGTKHIGILFPKRHQKSTDKTRSLGALPTRSTVYELLKIIDWQEANIALSSLWKILGYEPNLIVERKFKDPKDIIDNFKSNQKACDDKDFPATIKKN